MVEEVEGTVEELEVVVNNPEELPEKRKTVEKSGEKKLTWNNMKKITTYQEWACIGSNSCESEESDEFSNHFVSSEFVPLQIRT